MENIHNKMITKMMNIINDNYKIAEPYELKKYRLIIRKPLNEDIIINTLIPITENMHDKTYISIQK